MKYIILCMAAVAVSIILGYLIARIIQKFCKRTFGKACMILITMLSCVVVAFLLTLAFFGVHYSAGEKALEALKGSDTVSVEVVDGGYFFDGPSDDRAIIFYPGAKVEAEAYAPLMLKLAVAGYDCFLADMPFNFALLGTNTADKFISAYDYDYWLMAGHSMGGIVASSYAEKHSDIVDGIILLASYSTNEIDDNISVCSIRGSKDGCLNIKQYESYRKNLPDKTKEYVVAGGNHAQFGDYGVQRGDGTAYISDEEQLNRTIDAILEFDSQG